MRRVAAEAEASATGLERERRKEVGFRGSSLPEANRHLMVVAREEAREEEGGDGGNCRRVDDGRRRDAATKECIFFRWVLGEGIRGQATLKSVTEELGFTRMAEVKRVLSDRTEGVR